MRISGKTSKLLGVQKSAETELNARFAGIFERYRYVAFVDRHDQLFKEHWTPEIAASGYRFSRFELRGEQIVLHGTQVACGFIYRISIAFPQDLVDTPEAIESYFEKKCAEAAARCAANETLPEPGSQEHLI
ncbi:MAG TPA: hypothetical protein VJV96_04440 [Candidatus Angelobacter sp.]|nr:hypothetical protein [Candidatus Angelobacter sp.]